MTIRLGYVWLCVALTTLLVGSAGCGGGGGGGGGGAGPAPGKLSVLPPLLTFKAPQNGANPSPKVFRIINTGGSNFSWTASVDVTWASLSSVSGTNAPGQISEVTVTVNIASLAVGTHTGKITISAPGAQSSPQTVSLSLEVTASVPIISASPSSLSFTATEGGVNPAAQSVNVNNSGVGTLDVIITPNASWITVSQTTGTAPFTFNIGVNITELGQGVYKGFVTLWSSEADNSPARVNVQLTVQPASVPPAGAKWTIMVYMNADNDLERYGIQDINEMEEANLPADVNAIVLVDRHPNYDNSNGNWTETRIYKISSDTDPNIINSMLISNEGELNLGDPAVLASFCNWAIANYPADKYGLVIWNHGAGWVVAGVDETNTNDPLTLGELNIAMSTVQVTQGSGFTFDLIVFDECLMGQLEVAYEIEPYADTMVGSEQTAPGTGMDYKQALQYLVTESNASPEALAVHFANTYATFYSTTKPTEDRTIAAYDLTLISNLADAVSTLATTLQTNMAAEYVNLTRAIETVESFHTNYDYYIDIADLCYVLRYLSTNPTVQSDCDSVINAVYNATLFTESGEKWPHPIVRGISIFFPEESSPAVISDYQGSSSFAASPSPWVDMINSYYSQLASDTIDPNVSGLALSSTTVSSTGSISLTATISDNTFLKNVTVYSGTVSGSVMLFLESVEVEAPSAATLPDGREVYLWGAGPYSFTAEWKPSGWAVSDGANTFLAGVEVTSAEEGIIEVYAKYKEAGNPEIKDAVLDFDVETGDLVAAFVISANGEVGEVELEIGDQIKIVVDGLDISTGEEVSVETGTFIISSSTELFLTTVPLPTGTYNIGVVAEDISGNFGWASENVTVTNP